MRREIQGRVDRAQPVVLLREFVRVAVSYSDARLVEIWSQMREAGFGESKEFFPEVLDHCKRAADQLAHAEAQRFVMRTEGRIDEETDADMLRIGLPLMLDFFGLLRTKFFIRYLTEISERKRETTKEAAGMDAAGKLQLSD